MALRTSAFLVCLGVAWPAFASAQPALAPEAAGTPSTTDASPAQDPNGPPPAELEGVEIAGTARAQTDRIDRRTYNVAAQDPLAPNSTALEVIGRLPSVSVSSSGTITLLGQGTASVLIDGKPITNVEVLRTLLGSDLDRVEIMTNPSSEFRAQGTGGVVNVITRRRRPLGVSGAAIGTADTLGNVRLSSSASTTADKLTVTINTALQETTATQDRALNREPLVPTVVPSVEVSAYRQSGQDGTLSATATYQYDQNLSTTFGGRVSRGRSESDSILTRTISGSTPGGYDERTEGRAGSDSAEVNAELNLKTFGQRASTKLSASLSSNEFFTDETYARTFAPSAPQTIFGTHGRYETDKATFAAAFEYDPSENLVLKAGLNVDSDEQVITRLTDTPFPTAATSLSGGLDVWAAYGSAQWPIHGWTVMPGLRAERALYDLDNMLLDRESRVDLFPSLFLRRPLSAEWTVNLSYSRRINRPDLGRLDPRPVFSSPTDVAVGAPDLAPEFTDAFEARLEYVSGENNVSATVYRRLTTDVWQPSFSLTPDDIVVQTFINAGTRTNTGLDMSFRRVFSDRFRATGTVNLYRSDHDALTEAGFSEVSSTQFSATLFLTYKPLGSDPAGDLFQWSARYSGPSRGYQTETSEYVQSSLSWRHPLTERLASVLTVTDLLDSGDQTFTLITPELEETSEVRGLGPQVKWSLSYRFGALE